MWIAPISNVPALADAGDHGRLRLCQNLTALIDRRGDGVYRHRANVDRAALADDLQANAAGSASAEQVGSAAEELSAAIQELSGAAGEIMTSMASL